MPIGHEGMFWLPRGIVEKTLLNAKLYVYKDL